MAKLSKNYYYNKKGEQKINCYVCNIPKAIVDKTNIKDNEIKITSKDNKIIIERA